MKNNTEKLNSENTNSVLSLTDISEIKEELSQENTEKAQYEYLKLLNQKLSVFKKQENTSEGKIEQIVRR